MRFEAKHKYFKKLASHIGNFINISYTLSMRHQFLQATYIKIILNHTCSLNLIKGMNHRGGCSITEGGGAES